jgi:pilus assembly protein CpaE
MADRKIRVAILAPSPEMRDLLARHVEASQHGLVRAAVEEYCTAEDDHPTQQLLEAQPEIVLVDMTDERAAIKSLQVLHCVLPESWLYACGPAQDPQLIIETMQAGAREYLPQPVNAGSVTHGLSRYIEIKERARSGQKSRGKIYTVTAGKGGSGATSVAINLAATLSMLRDTRTAVIDMNSPVGDAAAYLNAKPEFSVMDALGAATKLDRMLLDTYMCQAGNIALLAGSAGYSTNGTVTPAALTRLLRVVSSAYTHTFVDLPSSLDQDIVKAALDASEAVLVVITPELPAIWRTHRLMTFLNGTGSADRIRLILNRDDSRDEINAKEIARALGHPVYWRLPNSYVTAIQAINKGKPLVEVNHSGLAASYRRLASELTGVAFEQPRTTLARLFSRAG